MLQPLEQDILQLLAAGLHAREIAERVGIPIQTVHASLQSIMTKLRTRSTLEALIVAIRQGLIELPPE